MHKGVYVYIYFFKNFILYSLIFHFPRFQFSEYLFLKKCYHVTDFISLRFISKSLSSNKIIIIINEMKWCVYIILYVRTYIVHTICQWIGWIDETYIFVMFVGNKIFQTKVYSTIPATCWRTYIKRRVLNIVFFNLHRGRFFFLCRSNS